MKRFYKKVPDMGVAKIICSYCNNLYPYNELTIIFTGISGKFKYISCENCDKIYTAKTGLHPHTFKPISL